MSSLQKFHRRTQSVGQKGPFSFTAIGSGNDTVGYWLGTAFGSTKMIVSPKSTEQSAAWGSNSNLRNTANTIDGILNTDTLVGFGSSITNGHPAAYYCKNLTTGGYNTWYLPAIDELKTLYSNKSATPFATANAFTNSNYWSSTENTNIFAWFQNLSSGVQNNGSNGNYQKSYSAKMRAVRKSTI